MKDFLRRKLYSRNAVVQLELHLAPIESLQPYQLTQTSCKESNLSSWQTVSLSNRLPSCASLFTWWAVYKLDVWDKSKRFRKRSISCQVKKLLVWLEEHRNNNLQHQNCEQIHLERCWVVFTCYFIQKLHCWGFMTWVWVVCYEGARSRNVLCELTQGGHRLVPHSISLVAANEISGWSGVWAHSRLRSSWGSLLLCQVRWGAGGVGGDEKEETREEAWGVENVAEECKIKMLIMVWRWWLWWERWSRRRRWRSRKLEMGKIVNRVKEMGKLLHRHFIMWSFLIMSD